MSLKLSFRLEHVDHGSVDLSVGPPEIIRWEQWSRRPITSAFVSTGPGDEDVDINLGMGDMAFMCYAALKRTPDRATKLPPFEIWTDGLEDLEMADDDPDPTNPDPSDTP